MKAATYNPDTLKRIRDGASARELGWDSQFYSSVCRKHGLEPVVTGTTNITSLMSNADAPPLAPVIVKIVTPSPAPPPIASSVFFDAETFEVRRDGKIVCLVPNDFYRALVLAKVPPDGEGLSAIGYAARIGTNRLCAKTYASRLRTLLRPLGIVIPNNYRGVANYCLTDKVTGQRIVLAATKDIAKEPEPRGA